MSNPSNVNAPQWFLIPVMCIHTTRCARITLWAFILICFHWVISNTSTDRFVVEFAVIYHFFKWIAELYECFHLQSCLMSISSSWSVFVPQEAAGDCEDQSQLLSASLQQVASYQGASWPHNFWYSTWLHYLLIFWASVLSNFRSSVTSSTKRTLFCLVLLYDCGGTIIRVPTLQLHL